MTSNVTRAERYSQIIQTTWKEGRQKRLAPLSIGQWWEAIKNEVINPALDDAENALKGADLYGRHIPMNGSGEMLEAGSLENSSLPLLTLSFQLNGEVVRLRSSEADLDKNWERAHLTEDEVDAKVVSFLQKAASMYSKPTSLSSGIA
jgi:hypothetical protein